MFSHVDFKSEASIWKSTSNTIRINNKNRGLFTISMTKQSWMCDRTCRPRVSPNCNLPITGEGRRRRGRACAVTLVSHEARHTDDADGCARASGRCIPIIYCWGFHPRGKYPRFLLLVLIVFDVLFHVKVSDLKSTWENTFKNKIHRDLQ